MVDRLGDIEHSLAFEVCERSGQLPWDCGLSACENGCATKTVEVVPAEQLRGAVEALRAARDYIEAGSHPSVEADTLARVKAALTAAGGQ